jgi:uncharacterized membrane protein
LIFASAIYMLFSRAAIPAWMEILKLNLKKNYRDKLFSLGSILAYAEGVFIAVFIGAFLDSYQNAWKIFFIVSSLFSFIGVYLQFKTPILTDNISKRKPINLEGFIKPWKDGFALIREKPDFAKFQIGTMASGFGIMLANPALTFFYADTLKLTLSEITVGRYIFMGLGFVVFSPFWARAMQKYSINYLTGFVCIGFAVFPGFMILALTSKVWIYLAFLSYGITQAGSHLIWNLSGPTFAKEEDSSKYSSINVLMIGIRGVIAPMIGGLLCDMFSPILVFILAVGICLSGSVYMFKSSASITEPSQA